MEFIPFRSLGFQIALWAITSDDGPDDLYCVGVGLQELGRRLTTSQASDAFNQLLEAWTKTSRIRAQIRLSNDFTLRPAMKVEAESVAFVVCSAIGLGTGTVAHDYVGLYCGDSKLLLESLEYVQTTASRILDAIQLQSEQQAA